MLTTATSGLIHSVLDGEASEAEAQQLQRLLTAQPAARAEFGAAERLFADFKNVPLRHPPEGLVASVMAAVEAPAAKLRRSSQLLSSSRVVSSGARDDSVRVSSNTHRSNRFQSFLRSIDMSQQTRSPFGSRKIWIGSAIALAAVVGVNQFGLDGKTRENDLIGTIAPAERYRAPQATADDIKVGTANGGQSNAAPTVAPADAATESANNSAQKSALKSAELAAISSAQIAALSVAQISALSTAQIAALSIAQIGALSSAQIAALSAAQVAALNAAQARALGSAQAAAQNSAQAAAKDSAEARAANAAQGAAQNAAQGTARDAAQAAAQNAAQAAAQRSAKGAAQNATR